MCYFLYVAINDGIDATAYEKAIKNSEHHFNVGDQNDVNSCVECCGNSFRITSNHCDCDTPIGQKQTSKKGLKEFEKLLYDLKSVRGVKYILLSKNWTNDTNSTQETVHINDIDVLHFLANIEDNCLYKIELFPKYY